VRLPVETREKIMLAILNHDTGQVGCLHAFPGSTQNAIHSSMTTGPREHRPEEATLVDVWCVAYGRSMDQRSTINDQRLPTVFGSRADVHMLFSSS
jgi:hypothetical protein